jgi:hypothetical protein
MYKIDLKTLKEITAILDAYRNSGYIANSGAEIIKRVELNKKSKKLSQKIKDNYTEIKINQ